MAELMLVNPRKRRKTRKAKKRARNPIARSAVSRRLAAPKKHRRIKRRHNPISTGSIVGQFKDGAIGAVGALAVDVAMQKLPIPASLTSGQALPLVKGLVGIGIGMMVEKVGKNRALGRSLAAGAVTVSLYEAGKAMVGPSIGLSDSGLLGENYFNLSGDSGLLGEDDLGYYSPANQFNEYSEMGEIYN